MAYTTIDKPTDYFNTVTYAGDGTADRSITGVGFQPDWVWIKNRSSASDHVLFDVIRGVRVAINSNDTSADDTISNSLTAFNTDGFSVSGNASTNTSSANYVGWNWLAGGTASSNSNGSITSTVSANSTSGFSIVSYTGTGSTATVGHGLNAVPKFFVIKDRDSTKAWVSYHASLGATKGIFLEQTSAGNTSSTYFNNTSPTSSVFTIANSSHVNTSSDNYIAYCFAEKKGFSKFGSYTGNGNADGTFVYLGFSPTWVMVKRSDGGTENWQINDNKRKTFNVNSTSLFANTNGAETNDGMYIDMLSNGFKARETGGGTNGSGSTYIFMAFAESPFVTGASGIPTTAR